MLDVGISGRVSEYSPLTVPTYVVLLQTQMGGSHLGVLLPGVTKG